MEPAREPPWAEHEKVYLLAEILKASVPSHTLLNIIRESNIQPKWEDIPLPQGRSVRSCQNAFTNMNNNVHIPADYRHHRPQLPAPITYPGHDIAKKRAHQPEITTPLGRLLQPRPPNSYPGGDYMSGPAYSMSPVGEPANKKKRGRPTKAEAQARADAAAARGEVYPPPRKGRPSVSTSTSEPPSAEIRQTPDVSGALPLQPMAVMTPQHTQPERGSESSSGKKKRSKPTPLDLEKPPRELSGTQSPLAFGPGTGDPIRPVTYSTFTPVSAQIPSATDARERDLRLEGVEESQARTTTPRSFKDTVGI